MALQARRDVSRAPPRIGGAASVRPTTAPMDRQATDRRVEGEEAAGQWLHPANLQTETLGRRRYQDRLKAGAAEGAHGRLAHR